MKRGVILDGGPEALGELARRHPGRLRVQRGHVLGDLIAADRHGQAPYHAALIALGEVDVEGPVGEG